MWKILQHHEADDFVIATGKMYSVRDFVELAFKEIGIQIIWSGTGLDEKGIDKASGKVLVEVDSNYFRPTEVMELLGNPTKAIEKLGWNPDQTSISELVQLMVKSDIKIVKKELIIHEAL
jgi:GDPmannose 4,6-dehydratase